MNSLEGRYISQHPCVEAAKPGAMEHSEHGNPGKEDQDFSKEASFPFLTPNPWKVLELL